MSVIRLTRGKNPAPTLFLSYCWKYRKVDVHQIADYLENVKKFNVWIDKNEMHGSTIDAMADGISSADVVLVFFSDEYKNSRNCRKEAEFADQRQKLILPVKMHADCDPDGWLGFIFGSKLWIKCYDGFDVAAVGDSIVNEVEKLIPPWLVLVDCPDYPNAFRQHRQRDREAFLKTLDHIYETSNEVALLIIHGDTCSGKTSFVSSAVSDKFFASQLIHQCNIGLVVWINCFRWQNEAKFNSEVTTVLLAECHQLICQGLSLPSTVSFDQLISNQKLRRKRLLIVFDDVFHFPLMKFVHNLAAKMVELDGQVHGGCIAITKSSCAQIMQSWTPFDTKNSEDTRSLLWHDIAKNVFEIEPFSNNNVLQPIRPDVIPKDKADWQKTAILNGFANRILQRANNPSIREACDFPEMILKDVPQFDNCFARPDEEDAVRRGIRALFLNEEEGKILFCIDGGGGIGKSTLVANALTNPKNKPFFQQHCNGFQIAIWLNCYQWKDGFWGNRKSEQEFIEELLKLGRSVDPALTKEDEFKDIEQMARYFDLKGQQLLIVLDDVFHSSILACLRKKYPKGHCLVLTRDAFRLRENTFDPFIKSKDIANPYSVKCLSESNAIEIFQMDYAMKDHLKVHQLSELARRSCGLPLLVNMMGSKLRDEKQHGRNLDKVFNTIVADIGKCKFDESERGERSAKQFFRNILDQFSDEQRQRYYTFLLFDPVQPVDIDDLVVLWKCEGREDAKDILEDFEKSAVARCTIETNRVLAKTPHWRIHQILHETAVDSAEKMFATGERKQDVLMSKLRLHIIGSLVSQLSDEDIRLEALLSRFIKHLLVMNRTRLLCEILHNIRTTQFIDTSVSIDEADVVSSQSGTTALAIAAETGHQKLLELFYSANPESASQANNYGETPIILGARSGNLEVVKFLAEKAPDTVLQEDRHGETPMVAAVEGGNLDIIKFLADKEPLLMSLSNVDGVTPTMCAALRQLNVVKFFAEKLPDSLTETDEKGENPLMFAARAGNIDVVKFLNEKVPGCVLQVNQNGDTPMMLASRHGNLNVVAYLAEVAPSSLCQPNKQGDTPIMHAAMNFKLDVVTFLAEKAPNSLYEVNNMDHTPIMFAARNGSLQIVKYLAEKAPATVSRITNRGDSAINVAGNYRQRNVLMFLDDFLSK